MDTTVCEGDSATITCVIFFPSGTIPSNPLWGIRRNGVAVDIMRHTVTSVI